jgi:hypothetical protein
VIVDYGLYSLVVQENPDLSQKLVAPIFRVWKEAKHETEDLAGDRTEPICCLAFPSRTVLSHCMRLNRECRKLQRPLRGTDYSLS